MKKIAILGCENSHAKTFLKFIKEDEKYKDIQVVGVYSYDENASQKLNDMFGVPVLSSYDEVVGRVDGVIITARDGKYHYEYAKPYIQSGIPMFIDKPITTKEEEAVIFMRECKESGSRVTGGSSCIHDEWVQTLKKQHENGEDGETWSGFVRAPLSLKNKYGDFFFYAEHLVGIVCEIFGYFPSSVKTFINGKKLTVVFRYNGYDVVGLYTDENYSCYYAMRASETQTQGKTIEISSDNPCFNIEFDEFYQLLCGGEQKREYKEIIAPVFIMSAIKKSLDIGEEVKIRSCEV